MARIYFRRLSGMNVCPFQFYLSAEGFSSLSSDGVDRDLSVRSLKCLLHPAHERKNSRRCFPPQM